VSAFETTEMLACLAFAAAWVHAFFFKKNDPPY